MGQSTATDIWFDGLNAPVRTVNCDKLIKALAGYFPGWRFSLKAADATPEAALLAYNGEAYLIKSQFAKEPKTYKTEVNVVCDLIGALARALLAEDSSVLCFHAAGVQVGAGLLMFPATKRAGKSVLSTALLSDGHSVFTDDYLPVRASPSGPVVGVATGVAPRLRLPLPSELPKNLQEFLDQNHGPENGQYRYVPTARVAKNGTQADFTAIILPERKERAGAGLTPVSADEAMKVLIHQNFSRGLDAEATLLTLEALLQSIPVFRLIYSDPCEASALLTSTFQDQLPKKVFRPDTQPRHDADLTAALPDFLFANKGLARVRVEKKMYTTDAKCSRILHLDPLAASIVELLDHAPATKTQICDEVSLAFPDADTERVKKDVHALIEGLLQQGVLLTR